MRTIHWKLSGKTDQLIVRQPSDPSHYNIALLPDFGRIHQGETVSQAELNAAVALSAAIAEQLVLRGVPFCTVLPEKDGVRLYEIRNTYEFHTVAQLSHTGKCRLRTTVFYDGAFGSAVYQTVAFLCRKI